jgi:BON domain
MQLRTLWLSSFGVGAAAAFLLDPTSGKRRRHRLADATTHIADRTRDSASTAVRDLRNRTHGVITIARRRFAREQLDDRVLEERVHSALGRVVSHPHAITVKVRQGHVTLDGPIPKRDEHRILHAVKAVAGVKHIEAAFDPHIQPAYEPSLKAARPATRTPPRPDFLQRNWAPATRAVAAGAGAALVGAGIARRDRAGVGLAAAGAALIARAATNLPFQRLVGVSAGRRAIEHQKTITGSAADRAHG